MTILGVIASTGRGTSGYTDETVNDSNYVMPENFEAGILSTPKTGDLVHYIIHGEIRFPKPSS